MELGYISLHRQIRKHWLFEEKRQFTKFEAWIDILFEVNHQDNKFLLGNEVVEVKRGSKITSLRKLADKWQWSLTKVNKFLILLEDDKMIELKKDAKKTLLTVVNYDLYQSDEWKKRHEKDTKETQEKHGSNTKVTRKKTNNNDNNANNANNANNEILKDISADADNEFEKFWKIYNKSKDKPKTFKKWNTLKKEEKEKIMIVIDDYVKSTPDKQYRKNPLTWLNGKCWDDELVINDNKNENVNKDVFRRFLEKED